MGKVGFLKFYTPHRLFWQINVRKAVNAVNAVEKKLSLFTSFLTKVHREIHRISLKTHRIRFKRLLNFTKNIIEVSDSINIVSNQKN